MTRTMVQFAASGQSTPVRIHSSRVRGGLRGLAAGARTGGRERPGRQGAPGTPRTVRGPRRQPLGRAVATAGTGATSVVVGLRAGWRLARYGPDASGRASAQRGPQLRPDAGARRTRGRIRETLPRQIIGAIGRGGDHERVRPKEGTVLRARRLLQPGPVREEDLGWELSPLNVLLAV